MPKPEAPAKVHYLLKFERIGRGNRDTKLHTYAADADELAEQVYRHARPLLVSRMFEVVADLEQGKGWIEGGRFGSFTIEEVKTDA